MLKQQALIPAAEPTSDCSIAGLRSSLQQLCASYIAGRNISWFKVNRAKLVTFHYLCIFERSRYRFYFRVSVCPSVYLPAPNPRQSNKV